MNKPFKPRPTGQRRTRPASEPPKRVAPPPVHVDLTSLATDSLALQLHHAASLIVAVRHGTTLTEALPKLWQDHPDLPAATRAAVQDLSYETLRAYAHGDAILAKMLSKPLPDTVHAILLVALQRLDARPDLAHTTVDQAVAVIGCHVVQLKPVANGVLRRYLRERDSLLPGEAVNPQAYWRHPEWWIRRLQATRPASWQDVLRAGNSHPPMTLRVNRRRADAQEVATQLQAAGHPNRSLGPDALLLETPRPVSELPGFAEGQLSVQDSGAQRAAQWLDLQDGQRVLDACAAPGGKSAHILEQANVRLLALELDAKRARRISENLERLGLSEGTTVTVADCSRLKDWWDGSPFDRILADVPCSASGVARRQPDIKWMRRNSDIASFAEQQKCILDALWQTLAQGGKMLYVTCSVFEEENSLQIARFVREHTDALRLTCDGELEQQLLPCAEHDGFYYALLQKRI